MEAPQNDLCKYFYKQLKSYKIMASRDYELYNAIKNDDLSYVVSLRSEKPLDSLYGYDIPEIFKHVTYPIMVAAYFGSKKVFNFYSNNSDFDVVDDVLLFRLMFIFNIESLF